MFRQEQIAAVIDEQYESFLMKDPGLIRESLEQIPIFESFVTIITGIRRCGKSTLLLQLLKEKYNSSIFLNFEDIRLAGFESSDFSRLLEIIIKRNQKVLFFDEIQLIDNWEIFVHQLLRDGYQVFLTGSNASLLSREMGTHLTGRNVTMELFPFSYCEFVEYKDLKFNPDSLQLYLGHGGIPEYIKNNSALILNRLLNDILVRDIAIRYNVRDIQALRQLTVFLISNVGNLISAGKLTGMFGIKAVSTLLEYQSHLQEAYLMEFVPLFSHSLKTQARNPKKVYTMDQGFVSEIAILQSENLGSKFENLIYLHLRRKFNEIYYFKGKKECDFVVLKRGNAEELVQACYKIDDMNFQREYDGLTEAMKFFDKKEGTIVTFDQKDKFEKDGLTVNLIPAHEFLSQDKKDNSN
jgi:uncharacterized protein